MRHVEFAKHFAEHFGEVVVIVDVRQEFLISRRHFLPINAMHIGVIEMACLLAANVLEHVVAFSCTVESHRCRERYSVEFFAYDTHLLHRTATENEQVVALLVELQLSPRSVKFLD